MSSILTTRIKKQPIFGTSFFQYIRCTAGCTGNKKYGGGLQTTYTIDSRFEKPGNEEQTLGTGEELVAS